MIEILASVVALGPFVWGKSHDPIWLVVSCLIIIYSELNDIKCTLMPDRTNRDQLGLGPPERK